MCVHVCVRVKRERERELIVSIYIRVADERKGFLGNISWFQLDENVKQIQKYFYSAFPTKITRKLKAIEK